MYMYILANLLNNNYIKYAYYVYIRLLQLDEVIRHPWFKG